MERAQQLIQEARQQVRPALRSIVDSMPGSLRCVAAYHFGWTTTSGQPHNGNGGKHIRPALLLSVCRTAGGDPNLALTAAVGVELIQQFTLLHDDIIDQDPERHGRPATWKAFGTAKAMLLGDALLAQGLRTFADLGARSQDAVRQLADCVISLCEGEIDDIDLARRTGTASMDEYLRTAEAKTGELLRATCALAASLSGCRPHQIQHLAAFGAELGVAFQVGNDLLGLWGDPQKTGKPTGIDLMRKQMTMPVLAAITSDTSAGREFTHLFTQPSTTTEQAARGAALAARAGAYNSARLLISSLTTSAREHLLHAFPDLPQNAELDLFVEMAAGHFEAYTSVDVHEASLCIRQGAGAWENSSRNEIPTMRDMPR